MNLLLFCCQTWLMQMTTNLLLKLRFKEQIGDVLAARAAYIQQTRKESDSDFVQNVISRANMEKRLMFVWDACKDLTLIILMVAAATSLVLGIKSEGIKERWYDGGSIAFAVILVIVVTATSDYKQSLQFRDLNEEKRNIRLEVIRGGRRVEISIYCRWQWCYALMASGSDDALKSVGLVLA
ncbi:hypothetical protein S83_017446, partial [Arachis hypogaea]